MQHVSLFPFGSVRNTRMKCDWKVKRCTAIYNIWSGINISRRKERIFIVIHMLIVEITWYLYPPWSQLCNALLKSIVKLYSHSADKMANIKHTVKLSYTILFSWPASNLATRWGIFFVRGSSSSETSVLLEIVDLYKSLCCNSQIIICRLILQNNFVCQLAWE